MSKNTRILSWNVNGIRAISRKNFFPWISGDSPDILCVQETKAEPAQLTKELLNPENYLTFWSSAVKKGYSGTATFSKLKPLEVKTSPGILSLDREGRIISADYGTFILFNIYFPNGRKNKERLDFKLKFYEEFLTHMDKLRKKGRNIVVCGDFNTAHSEIDLSHPGKNGKVSGFLPVERAWLDKVISHGYIDTFRHFNKRPENYTWWDYKTRARERNIGWRLDYFFISGSLLPNLKKAFILDQVPGSDHCPVGIELAKL